MTLDDGQGFVRGDKFQRRWHVTNLNGWYASQAWLMVKTAYNVADESATISKEISGTDSAGTGQIEDTGQTSGVAVLRFDLTNSDTTALTAGTRYYWDAQIEITDGSLTQIITFASGTVDPTDQVVQAT